MNNLLIREWLNGGLIPLNLWMMFITWYSIYNVTKFKSGWNKVPGASTACALWWIFFADFLRSTLAWSILRNATAQNAHIKYMSAEATIIYIMAAIIATTATMRCIYLLSPKEWGHKAWIAALISTVIFLVLAYGGLFNWVIQASGIYENS